MLRVPQHPEVTVRVPAGLGAPGDRCPPQHNTPDSPNEQQDIPKNCPEAAAVIEKTGQETITAAAEHHNAANVPSEWL